MNDPPFLLVSGTAPPGWRMQNAHYFYFSIFLYQVNRSLYDFTARPAPFSAFGQAAKTVCTNRRECGILCNKRIALKRRAAIARFR
ncbi:hypothetical protein [Candidatus Allofournierella excrementavium]|uniref:hypothetical protein n=1 Tax=Candidatus Allofournierella excrementavium TaxID=2838591 RepID=UPI003AF55845